jgi:hypothetical protein
MKRFLPSPEGCDHPICSLPELLFFIILPLVFTFLLAGQRDEDPR